MWKALALSVAFSGLSCSKDAGTIPMVPTTAETINKAQTDFLSLVNPEKIQTGEFVYFIKSQQVFTGQQEPSESLMEEESFNVLERRDSVNFFEITLQKEVIDHLTEGSPHSIFKDVLYFRKNAVETEARVLTFQKDSEVRFYNLKTEDVKVARPIKVQERDPCDGPPQNCLISARKISYDIVFVDPLNPQTTKVETWLSLDVPYFATILQSCYTTLVAVETARPLVRQCKTVFDYRWK